MPDASLAKSERLSSLLACPLALLTSFVVFVRHHDCSLASAEVLLAGSLITGVGLLAGAIALRAGEFARVATLAFFVALFVEIQTDWIDSRMAFGLSVVGFGVVGWMTRARFASAIGFLAAVMILATLPMPGGTGSLRTTTRIAEGASTSNARLPSIVHIVVDEHIGVAGIPQEFDPDASLRNALRKRYTDLGFEIYGRAFSRYYDTHRALPYLMNFGGPFRGDLYFDRLKRSVGTNAYFASMSASGYEVHVLQTDYIDFCNPEEDVAPTTCTTYTLETIKALETLDLTTWNKSKAIVGMFMRLSFVVGEIRDLYNLLPRATRNTRWPAPLWPKDLGRVSAVSAMSALSTLDAWLGELRPGQLYFVHLMLPHFPFVYREDCSVRPEPTQWLTSMDPAHYPRRNDSASRAARYPAYLEQLRCVTDRLADVIERLDRDGTLAGATVIIHGDHGSRIDRGPPRLHLAKKLYDRDLIDAFSTLFVVRQPGTTPRYDERVVSTSELLEAIVLRGHIPQGREWIETRNVVLSGPNRGFIEVPMPWSTADAR